MESHSVERIKGFLGRVIESYGVLKNFERDGCERDELREELIDVRDACEELPILFGQIARETNLDLNVITQLTTLKPDFMEGIKLLIMQLTEPLFPADQDWLKKQANMAVTLMNMTGKMDVYKLFYAFLR